MSLMTGVIGGIIGGVVVTIAGLLAGMLLYAEGERNVQDTEEGHSVTVEKP